MAIIDSPKNKRTTDYEQEFKEKIAPEARTLLFKRVLNEWMESPILLKTISKYYGLTEEDACTLLVGDPTYITVGALLKVLDMEGHVLSTTIARREGI